MADEAHMHTPRPENKVNWNTLIQIFTLATMIAGGGTVYGTMTARMDQSERAQVARDVRIDALDQRTQQIDNLAYRVTVQEQSQSNLSRSVEELKALVNGQGTDIRVIREILGRLEDKLDERAQ